MRGAIVINANAGRALRKKRAALLAADVVNCAGDFGAGDKVYVVVRGEDGGQSVIATGTVRCDEGVLQQVRERSAAAYNVPIEGNAPAVVIPEQDLQLLWPKP
jgi:glutamate 5-kinase